MKINVEAARRALLTSGWAFAVYAAALAIFLAADLAKRPIWTDETFSYYQVASKGLFEMLGSFDAGVNALPYTYFILLWFVDALVGLTAVTLRLPSALLAWLALVLLHRLLARRFDDVVAFVACVVPLLLSRWFVDQSHEARPYALYLLAAVCALYAGAVLVEDGAPARRALALNGAAAFFLPMAHYVGIFYTGLVGAAVLAIRLKRRSGGYVPVAVSFVLGWAAFGVIQVSQILIFLDKKGMIAVGWIPRPKAEAVHNALISAGSLLPMPVLIVLGVFIALRLATWKSARSAPRDAAGRARGLFLVVVALLWAAVPPALIFLASKGFTNLSLPRYSAPSLFSATIISAFALGAFVPRGATAAGQTRRWPVYARALVGVGVTLFFLREPVMKAVDVVRTAPHALSQKTIKKLYPRIASSQLPCVTNNLHVFFQYTFYRGDGQSLSMLRATPEEVEAWGKFDRRLPVFDPQRMTELDAFLYVRKGGGVNHFPKFRLGNWAKANGYEMTKTGKHAGMTFFEVRRK
jgi:hypothetical protein